MQPHEKLSEVERIRRVFDCRLPVNTLSDDEYRELKWDIAMLRFEDVAKWLPLLLIHEIETAESLNGDALVYLLDGNLSGSRSAEAEFLRASRREVLERFTKDQAEAVRLWLKRVAKRKYGKLCKRDIESAISYWSEREKSL